MSQVNWGSVPDWVTALVTSTSVAVAVISYSRNLYDKVREQAAQVSYRVVEDYVEAVEISPKVKVVSVGFKVISVGFEVTNRSDSPVYDLKVTFPKSKIIGKPLQTNELPPRVTATGKTRIRKRYISKISPEIHIRSTEEIPTLTFTDALGRRWRKRNGHIRRSRQKTQWYTVLQKQDVQDIQDDQTTWTTSGRLASGT